MAHSENIIYAGPENLKEILSGYIGETEKKFFLTDTNTADQCYPVIKKLFHGLHDDQMIVLDAGDDAKDISSLHHIWSFLLHHGATRNSRLINLGGGMITDIGGFAASTFMRGIPFVHIPTSLLGMVDAAIGGKSAINISKVKNQAGSFSLPEAVVVYPDFLKTLPDEEWLSGYAEILKTAIAFDKDLFTELTGKTGPARGTISDHVIRKASGVKREVTSGDFHDRAERQCLNFGHSIGHALEALYFNQGKEVKHGYAVAAGIICEAHISSEMLKLAEKDKHQIEKYLLHTFPSVSFREKDIDGMITLIRHDKKNFRSDIRMSLIEGIGKCKFGIACPDAIIRDALKYYISIISRGNHEN